MEEVGLDFRATKDLDIVLYVEALDVGFVSVFWDFIKEGDYQNRQQSTGKDLFYRFYSPRNHDYPAMLELFSRVPDLVTIEGRGHLTPIPTSESMASLSAIILDEDYYQLIHSGSKEVAGLSVVEAGYLIPLKARAWLDLVNRKISGDNVDEKQIRKHKNDILRLYQLLTPKTRIPLSVNIKYDLKKFVSHIASSESVNMKSLGLKHLNFPEVVTNLKRIYSL